MSIAAPVLVESSPYRLRYLVTMVNSVAGITADIPNATLRADLAAAISPLRPIMFANTNGFGTIPPGPLTDAQVKDILNSDGSGASAGNDSLTRAVIDIIPRDGENAWVVDAVAVGGAPTVRVAVTAIVGVGMSHAYIDIHARHSIDL